MKYFLIVLNSCAWTLVLLTSFSGKEQKKQVVKIETINDKIQEAFLMECKIDSVLNVL